LQFEWIAALIGSVGSVVTSVAVLAYWLGNKFAEIDSRFKEIDRRFEDLKSYVDERFKEVDRRFKEIDRRFESIDRKFDRLIEAVRSSQEFMVDFLSYEGVLRREAAEVLKGEVDRTFRAVSTSMHANPLTKEEVEKLRKLLEKDELTLEEARELYEIANKLVYEYGTSETWKLLYYSRFWIGYNLRKMKEQRGKAFAEVELRHGGRAVKVRALVNAGASRSLISKRLADTLGCLTPLKEPYELRTADEEGRLRVIGRCIVDEVYFQGVKVPGGAVFEVAENLRKDLDLIIGRPEIDSWGIVFTPEGPKPRRIPIEFEIV